MQNDITHAIHITAVNKINKGLFFIGGSSSFLSLIEIEFKVMLHIIIIINPNKTNPHEMILSQYIKFIIVLHATRINIILEIIPLISFIKHTLPMIYHKYYEYVYIVYLFKLI